MTPKWEATLWVEDIVCSCGKPQAGAIAYRLSLTNSVDRRKGVICKIVEPEDMPMDADGNRADIVMDPNSTVSRMNIGRLYEQYTNAASRDVAKTIRRKFDALIPDAGKANKVELISKNHPQEFDAAWQYLLRYYEIVSPKMHAWFTGNSYQGTSIDHMTSVYNCGVYLYLPPDNAPETNEVIMQLEKEYRPTYGPVTYVGNSGQRVTTKKPVRVGSLYVLLLEKTGDDWTAVSSGKLQHLGVLSQVTNSDKYSQPTRSQAIRALGEAEVRIYASYAGPEITADILDRSNSPATHRGILHNLLEAERPTDIQEVVGRKVIPLGGSKPLQLVRHIAECGGWRFAYHEYKDKQQ